MNKIELFAKEIQETVDVLGYGFKNVAEFAVNISLKGKEIDLLKAHARFYHAIAQGVSGYTLLSYQKEFSNAVSRYADQSKLAAH